MKDERYVEKVLAVSTAHMPSTAPDWGALRTTTHQYGVVVFVCSDPLEGEPEWAAPLMRAARELDCSLILLDEANDVYEGIPTWDW